MKFHPEILAAFGSGIVAAWIYCGLALCLIMGGVLVIHHRRRTRHRRIHAPVPPLIVPTKARGKITSSPGPSVAIKNNAPDSSAWPRPVFRRKRRKRVFNYSKFYTSVMRELSLHTYHPANVTNGKSLANGHSNGATNGHANGHPGGHVVSNGTNVNHTIKSEIEDLIANQEILIQAQKSLLEEQTRLIEEKNRIIEEQAAFLKMKRAA